MRNGRPGGSWAAYALPFAASLPTRCPPPLILQAFSSHDPVYVLVDPCSPRLALFGRGKVEEIAALPPRCKSMEGLLQGRRRLQLQCEFLRHLESRWLLQRHLQTGLLHFHGLVDVGFERAFQLDNVVHTLEADLPRRLHVLRLLYQDAGLIL